MLSCKMGRDVFISYKSENKKVAQRICKQFEDCGIKCWIAYRDEEAGKSYLSQISNAIEETCMLVFVFSSHSNESPVYVARELEEAIVTGHLEPIVFRIEDVRPSKMFRLLLRTSHWLDAFPKPKAEHYKKLTTIVKRRLYERDLKSAKQLLKKRKWILCAKECGCIFEKAMKELLNGLFDWSQDKGALDTVSRAEKKIGKGKTTFNSFRLPELCELYAEGRVFDELRKQLTSPLQQIQEIEWDVLVDWYDAVKGICGSDTIRAEQARKMFYMTRLFLYDCELAGDPHVVDTVSRELRYPEKCPRCKQPLDEDWNYCPQCGARLSIICKNCNRLLRPDQKRCPYCEVKVPTHHWEIGNKQGEQQEYKMLCKGVWADGAVNIRERKILENKRLQLGLSIDEAMKIERSVAPPENWEYMLAVRAVLIDGVIDDDERIFLEKRIRELNIDAWTQKQIEDVEIAVRKGALRDLELQKQDDNKSRKTSKKKRKVKKKKKVEKTTKRKRKAIQKKKKRT